MTDRQKQNTVNFLKDNDIRLHIREKLSDALDEESKTATLRLDDQVNVSPFDPCVQTGDIRLFSQTDVLTYCVVLPWDELHYLTIPFSHRKYPATDAEMFAEHHEDNADYCQVLQIWNARTVSAPLMMNTWKIGQVSTEEISRIKKMLEHFWFNDAISHELADLTGVPIRNSLDPRVSFKAEELDHFAALDKEDIDFENMMYFFRLPEDGKEENERLISFPAEPVLAAAAGEEQLSEVFRKNENRSEFLTGMELLNFEPVSPGEELPPFVWSDRADKTLPTLYGHPVLILKRGSEQLLGTSVLEKDGAYSSIHLRNPVRKADVPAIDCSRDIILLIL